MNDEQRSNFSLIISKAVSGTHNPMYGKTHKKSSILQMSNNNNGTNGKIWIFNKLDGANKCVNIIDLSSYLAIGWKLGRIGLKQDKNKTSHIGLKWVHNKTLRLETC